MKKLLAILALAVVPSLSSCEATAVLDESQVAQVEQIDANIATLEVQAGLYEKSAALEMKQLIEHLKAGNVEGMSLSIRNYNLVLDDWKDAVDQIAVQAGNQQAIFDEALESRVGGYSAMAGSIVSAIYPPAAPFAGLLDMLTIPLAGLFFKRPRRAILRAAKNVAKGQVGDAGRALFSMVGFKHTNGDPLEILRGARRAALDNGETAKASQIDTLIATLDPPVAA